MTKSISPGALRVAKAIPNYKFTAVDCEEQQQELAALIDESTGLPELLEALKQHHDYSKDEGGELYRATELFATCERLVKKSEGSGEHAVRASSKNPALLTEPASGKFKMSIFDELLKAAQDAATHLKRASIGSGMYELGIRLQLAIERAAK